MSILVLASGSPRRKELLQKSGINFIVCKSDIDENIEEKEPAKYATTLAHDKAASVLEQFPDKVVLGADTIVVVDGKVLGKPNDRLDAITMLNILSGRTHDVITGVAIVGKEKREIFFEQTSVTFWELTDDEIEAYVNSNEPFDKAGSYGIQDIGASLVKEIHGDYFNVVGLPISKVVRKLREFGIKGYI